MHEYLSVLLLALQFYSAESGRENREGLTNGADMFEVDAIVTEVTTHFFAIAGIACQPLSFWIVALCHFFTDIKAVWATT